MESRKTEYLTKRFVNHFQDRTLPASGRDKAVRSLTRKLLLVSAVRAMGGQAVLNGVMMRGEMSYAVACRRMDDSIDISVFDVPSFAQKFVKIPFLRGVMGLGEAMALGYRALMHSADLSLKDEEEKLRIESGEEPKKEQEEEPKALGKVAVGISIAISIVFFVAMFKVGPLLLADVLKNQFGLSKWVGFMVESVLRLALFVGYLYLVSLSGDIKRVFQYHGAEHKAIAAYENDVVLTPASAQQFTTAHVRCGTNFLLIVMVMSAFFYAVFSFIFPDIPFWGLVLSRIFAIPLIAGVSYELIKAASFKMGNVFTRAIVWPGLQLQKVTTRRPTNEQCEVAIASLEAVFTSDQVEEVASRTRISATPSWQTVEAVAV